MPKGVYARTAEARANIAAAARGKVQSAETVAKRAAALRGRTYSAEHRARISAARTGMKFSAETCKKISAALRARPVTDETRQKRSIAMSGRRLGPPSSESIEKMRASKLANPTRYWLGKVRGPHSEATRLAIGSANRGKPCYHVRRQTYRDIAMRSTWEVRTAAAFDALGIRWEYESRRFILSDTETYLPDFYLPDDGAYWEVKGYFGPRSQSIIALFRRRYPDIPLIVAQLPVIEALERAASRAA